MCALRDARVDGVDGTPAWRTTEALLICVL